LRVSMDDCTSAMTCGSREFIVSKSRRVTDGGDIKLDFRGFENRAPEPSCG
jgi:hypothetical protein